MTYGSREDLETLCEVEAFGTEKGLSGAVAGNNDNCILEVESIRFMNRVKTLKAYAQ